jgi:Prp8 binding protein
MSAFDDDDTIKGPASKRFRGQDGGALVEYSSPNIRTSSLDQPTMKLTGHKGSVYALAYDATGESLVSGGFDSTCFLWNASGSCENYNILQGHKNAILDVCWSEEHVATASADKTLGWFHANTGVRVKRLVGHAGIVNAVDAAGPLLLSASDDCTCKLWDVRIRRGETGSLEHDYQVTSVAFADETHMVYTGGIDNVIVAWDVRKQEKVFAMKGHADTITCLALHPKGTHLLSNSMDGTIKSWDIRPFVTGKRHAKTFLGATHNAEKGLLKCAWSADGKMVTGGSADRMVHIWDELTAQEVSYDAAASHFHLRGVILSWLTRRVSFVLALSTARSYGLCQYCGLSSKSEYYCIRFIRQIYLCW